MVAWRLFAAFRLGARIGHIGLGQMSLAAHGGEVEGNARSCTNVGMSYGIK